MALPLRSRTPRPLPPLSRPVLAVRLRRVGEVMDLDALREALESDERLYQMMRDRGLTPPSSPIIAAARAVLDSEEWVVCEPHGQAAIPSDADMDEFEVVECAGAMLGWWGDCSMVRRRLLAEEGT